MRFSTFLPHFRRSDARKLGRSDVRTPERPDARTSGRSDVRTLGRPDARTSERPGVRTPSFLFFQFLRSSRRGPDPGRAVEPAAPRRRGAGPRRDERKNCEKRTKTKNLFTIYSERPLNLQCRYKIEMAISAEIPILVWVNQYPPWKTRHDAFILG